MSTPDEHAPPPERADLDVAFTPRQILGGFALLAALILVLLRLRRPRRSADD